MYPLNLPHAATVGGHTASRFCAPREPVSHGSAHRTHPRISEAATIKNIILTGGGAKLRGLEDLIHIKTGINTLTAEDPLTAVAVGAGHYVEITGCSRIGTRSRE